MIQRLTRHIFCALLLGASLVAHADTVQVAVAANFTAPMKQIAAGFEAASGHRLLLSFGATGKFYAQISQGAPFDVFLSADQATAQRLADEGKAVAASRFTYATGRLMLWSAQPGLVDDKGEVLRKGDFKTLAIASPKLAPYGAAALEALNHMGLMARLAPRLVQGESIGQTFNFVSTGNAELGLIALSQVYENGKLTAGSGWLVPASYHAPIRQDAVLLTKGANQPAARALLDYLASDKAKAVIRAFGYDV